MTNQELIQQYYDEIKIILQMKYDNDNDEIEYKLLEYIKDGNWDKAKKLPKKKCVIADQRIMDIVKDFPSDLAFLHYMEIFYRGTHLLCSEFYRLMGFPEEEIKYWEEKENEQFEYEQKRIDTEDCIFPIEVIKAQMSFYGWNNINNMTDEEICADIDQLQIKEYLKYEKLKDGSLSISNVKNPWLYYNKYQANHKNIKSNIKPISISKGQDKIRDLLYFNNIPFIQEYNIKIDNQNRRFDFAIFDDNGIKYFIEYDGEQHYKPVEQWGGEEQLKRTQQNDAQKNKWATEQHKPLIRIPYYKKDIKLEDILPEYSEYLV